MPIDPSEPHRQRLYELLQMKKDGKEKEYRSDVYWTINEEILFCKAMINRNEELKKQGVKF